MDQLLSPELCNPSRCPASSRADTHAPTRNQRRRRLPSLRHRQGRHYQPCTLHRRGFYSCSFTPSKGVQRVRGGTSPAASRKNCDGSTGMALGARVGCTRAPTSYEKHVHRARSTRAAVLQPPLTRISFAAQASGASDDKYYYDTDDASNFYMELWGLRTSRMLTHTRARFRRAQGVAAAARAPPACCVPCVRSRPLSLFLLPHRVVELRACQVRPSVRVVRVVARCACTPPARVVCPSFL